MNNAYRDAVLADLPTAYWRMDSATEFSVPDASGHGHPLTLTGTTPITSVPGAMAGSAGLMFDGQSFGVTSDDVLIATDRATYSVECWVKLDPSVGTEAVSYRVIWSRATNADQVQSGVLSYFAFVDDAWTLVTTRANNEQEQLQAGGDFSSAFIHIVTTYDGGVLTLWVDGKPISLPSKLAVPKIAGALNIGKTDYGGNFVGVIDEVAVYDHALTAAQVQAHRVAAGR